MRGSTDMLTDRVSLAIDIRRAGEDPYKSCRTIFLDLIHPDDILKASFGHFWCAPNAPGLTLMQAMCCAPM
eukprot:jgi/Mesen1/9420/ME000614S08668